MNLLYFAPSIRRDYIDSILSRTFTQFPKLKRDYENVMRQRNALLKKIRDGEAQKQDLSFWDKTFAEKANLYHTYRCRFIDFVNSHLALISEFLPKYHMVFHYDTKISSTLEGESIVMEYL